jgi:HD-GYP domain-containing protein (c-di-GMP phosphodiesterase class II)
MNLKLSVNLGNLILSLSDALDLAYNSLAMHQQRTAFIAWQLGKAAGLDEKRIEEVFTAGLLHDIGALSVEEKVSLHENETTKTENHCIRGQMLFESNPWLASSAVLVRNHHRDWTDWQESRNTPEAFGSQLLYLADHLERCIDRNTYILHQEKGLQKSIKELAGRQIDSNIVDLFLDVSRREEFWLYLTSPRLYSLLLHHGPFRMIEIDLNSIIVFAELLCMIIDFKSPFTATHSSGVTSCAMHLAGMAGMSESEVKLMEAAGLLHDLGKLVVPNTILEKPGPLSPAEFAVIKQHSYYTYFILSTIRGLELISEWAAYHHERLDGEGYPFKREARELNLGTRIMGISDIFTALAEDRPYRRGMSIAGIKTILEDQASRGFQDPRLVKLLLDNIGDIRRSVAQRQAQASDYYRTKLEGCSIHPERDAGRVVCPSGQISLGAN